MCYSALVKADLSQLEIDYSAEVDQATWQELRAREKEFPKKIRFAAEDQRIFPNYFAPVICAIDKSRKIKPMRYSAFHPTYMAGLPTKNFVTYNVRRDSLNKRFWSESFGVHHGAVILGGFYEWVKVNDLLKANVISVESVTEQFEKQTEARRLRIQEAGKKYRPTKTESLSPLERQIVVQFTPTDSSELIVPVIFSYNEKKDQVGFAIVTDDPNEEIRAAGHDRMPILLTEDQLERWLDISSGTEALQNLLVSRKILNFECSLPA